MSNYLDDVRGLLRRHFAEVSDGGLVDKAPSKLSRGEGTQKHFFIMKVDLVGSTELLFRRKQSTYLTLAHTFLSTLDKIAQDHGADGAQTEYAGDSVLSYFPDVEGAALNVLCAAAYSRLAVSEIPNLGGVLSTLKLKCKIVLHYAPLVVSKIGPRADSILTAIGHPIHRVAKMEKEVDSGAGRATKEFFEMVPHSGRRYLSEIREQVPEAQPASTFLTSSPAATFASILAKPLPPAPSPQQTILGGLGGLQRVPQAPIPSDQLIAAIIAGIPAKLRAEPRILGYSVSWMNLYRDLSIPLFR